MLVQKTISNYCASQINSINQHGVKNYVMDKLQEKSPLHSSPENKKNLIQIRKRIKNLRLIKKNINYKLNNSKDPLINRKLRKIKAKIENKIPKLEKKFKYFHKLDLANRLINLASPANLLISGTGDSFRVIGYSLKTMNAVTYKFAEFKHVMPEVILAGTIFGITQFFLPKIYSYVFDINEM